MQTTQLSSLIEQIDQISEYTVNLRRKLHQIPEIGLEQHKTSAFIRKELSTIEGLIISSPNQNLTTAIIAQLRIPNSTETFLYRCQLDGLPLTQQNDLPYKSTNGFMHACGHDVHMACILSCIKMLVKNKEKLKRSFMFCFQPGEQGKGGADKMWKNYGNILEKADKCFAVHMANFKSVGEVMIEEGPITCHSNKFQIKINGKSAHCLCPHVGVDANFIGSALVLQLYSFSQLLMPPIQGGTITVTHLEGGSQMAKVSDQFSLKGTIRVFSQQLYNLVKEKITALTESICKVYGAEGKVQFIEGFYRTVVNDAKLVHKCVELFSKESKIKIIQKEKCFAGEDFCEFSQRKPSCYINLGCALPNSFNEQNQVKLSLQRAFIPYIPRNFYLTKKSSKSVFKYGY